jgi:hypothetical protein
VARSDLGEDGPERMHGIHGRRVVGTALHGRLDGLTEPPQRLDQISIGASRLR